ncbi:MAG: sodium-extruding oxaloacetate decarboxylase subunit alpha [Campylobacterales bacterium]
MVKITELSLRDGHQSLLATRLRTEDMIEAAKIFDDIGFHSIEVWGGATYDSCLRYLKEDPFERLDILKNIFKKTPLQMLLRGQNLVGYRHYADDVVSEFIRLCAEGGIDIFRVFDALNDKRNLVKSIEEIKKNGKTVQGAISYTISPVHDIGFFVQYAKDLVEMGVDTLCIKDMSGIITPYDAYELVSAIKDSCDVPLQFHTHSTSGFGFGSHLKAIEAGVDIVDLCNSALAEGTSHPCTQSMVATLKGTIRDTGLELEKMEEAATVLREKRRKYKKFESEYNLIDTRVLVNQIPGGMISNLANQLKEQNALDKMDEVLEEVPNVRKDFGYPPLVTPSSQIVGTQAVLNVLTGERYKSITQESKNYVKGMYGKAPFDIDKGLQEKVLGGEAPVECRPADMLSPELERAREEADGLIKSDRDLISYAIFESVAKVFLAERNSGKLSPEPLESFSDGSELPNEFNVTVHGERYAIKVEGSGEKSKSVKPFFVRVDGELKEVFVESFDKDDEEEGISKGGLPRVQSDGDVAPPMPGNIIKIDVSVGDKVKKGQKVGVVEAMKMENEIIAPKDGKVVEVFAKEGMKVETNESVMLIG